MHQNTHFAPAKATPVSTPYRYQQAKATTVSDNRPSWPTGPGCGARGRLRGPARQRANAPNHTSAHQAPPVWRAPEGWKGRLRCPWAAAGPGRASRRRAERSSLRGRLAGGPPPTGTPSSPAQQHTTRHPEHQRRNTPHRHNKTAQPHRGRAAQTIRERVSAGSRRCPDHRDRFPDGRSKCQA